MNDINYNKKIDLLKTIVSVLKHRNDPRFIEIINNYNQIPDLVFCSGKTNELYNGKPVCLIEAGTADEGLFACVRWALDGLFFCERNNFIPLVRFSDKSVYKDIEKFGEKLNAFEYYFEKTCALENEISSYPRIEYSGRNRYYAEQLNDGISYEVSDLYIEQMSIIMKKYLHFTQDVISDTDSYCSSLGIDREILGIHARGTDFRKNYKNHPIFVEPADYFQYIDEAIEQFSFKKIFIATDDSEVLNEFIEKYSGKIIYSSDSTRGESFKGVHIMNSNSPYEKGMEVIRDMTALSNCGGIITGLSQVAMMARIYAKSKGNNFIFDKTINKGINKNGKVYHKD